jgi:hypothetical protein
MFVCYTVYGVSTETIETTFIMLSITCKPFHAIKSRSIHGVTEDWNNKFKVYLLADQVSAEGQENVPLDVYEGSCRALSHLSLHVIYRVMYTE